jgi:hypothetical protein
MIHLFPTDSGIHALILPKMAISTYFFIWIIFLAA